MKNTAFLLLINLSALALSAQPCTILLESTDSRFETKPFQLVDKESRETMTLKAVSHGKFMLLIVTGITERLCPDKGDSVTFEFAGGGKVYSKNNFESNCDQRYAVYLNSLAPTALFDSLLQNELRSVELNHKGQITHGLFQGPQAGRFRNSWNCLAECLRSDSLANVVKEATDSPLFVVVESPPEFIGGYDALQNYIKKNLVVKRKDSGTVYVQFEISKDGSILNPKVIKGVSPETDAEAMRVIANMPKWKPGMQNDKPVRVQFVLPIRFK
jgi:TonB family protein